MTKKTGYGLFKAIKSPARTIFTWLFLFFGLFIFSNSILAESPAYFYDFESPDYTTGNINGQEKWIGSGSSTVSAASKLIGDQGVSVSNIGIYNTSYLQRHGGDLITSGEISFWWYSPTPSGLYTIQFQVRGTNINPAHADANIYMESYYQNGKFNGFPCPDNLYANTWYNFKIKWDSSVSTSTYQFDCGSGYNTNNLLNAFIPGEVMGFDNQIFSSIYIQGYNYGHGVLYLDAISTPIDPPASSDLTALVLPAYPPANSTTTLSGGQVGFNGLYSYNTSTDFTIYGLKAVLTDIADPSIQFTFDKDISENTSGSYTILGSLPDGTFLISWLFGYYDNAGFKFYYPAQDPAYVIMENSTYSATGTEAIYPTIPQDDCSLVSGVENWLCNIKNFFSNIFYISPAKMTELNSSLDKMKDKFPYNYIAVDQAFFTDLKNGINPTSTISLTIMGNSQIINFGVLQNSTGTVAGTTQNTSSVLKNLFSIIILIGFLIYAINYGRRIFK